ncbi:hypothetical protein FRP1_29400 (plasmid) [Pseudonocardia sp. EC080625-04]|uniref:flavin reductase family protein n=1 Tax=unclassified Pseudonocardia TaxID=2619320 RepID=UPI0006CB609C|nr:MULTISPECIES: flavin reductase family protein [unclassified Pseudonocardia]ALE76889.1 hypothetical protein FRP1_29400 [Pseudonocardia sp. EC080625-04]ALL85825.1 hypothetical protein AD017_32235 [Pseudonocardia sp. EC080619-01]
MAELDNSRIGDSRELRRVYGCFPSGVMALCAVYDDGAPVGIAVSSFTTISMDPPLVSVCAARSSQTWPLLADRARLGLSVLSLTQGVACRQLSSKTAKARFDGVGWHSTRRGAVLLEDAAAWLECTIDKIVDAGDHLLVLLGVQAFEIRDGVAPLVFHASTFHQLSVIPATTDSMA